jgi:hypothetical protein
MIVHLPKSDGLRERASLRPGQLKRGCFGDELMVGVAGFGYKLLDGEGACVEKGDSGGR